MTLDPDVTEVDEQDAPEAMLSWSDAQFFRAVALATHEAELEDDDGPARGPHYDW